MFKLKITPLITAIVNFYVTMIAVSILWTSAVSAATFVLPSSGESVVGRNFIVPAKASETLLDIARRYDVGYREIKAANPNIDPWLPKEGSPVVVPTQYVLPQAPRRGIVINLAEMRLYYFPESQLGQPGVVVTHPIGIGREGWSTPLGKTSVISKKKNPTWIPPESIRAEHKANGDPLPKVVPPGPDNPLGKFALRLGMPGYLIHGTNRPWGVGMRVSHGCIRLYPEDIASLFAQVKVGVSVNIVYQPFKAGIKDTILYLEAHVPLPELENPEGGGLTNMVATIVAATEKPIPEMHWEAAKRVADERTGIATQVGEVGAEEAL
ncbi:L,D-transpeptidase family protein [Nitrosococcus wardiae]|uniref:LysM peptidoglycan-binding domain-containing protein n=1 Tax=Nitrosococcus wardiae TaxID=1814290 RepID=A0A4P7BXW0_9GAMM|nr:L,D-transpeptidase family protein [Nitrosococcus wardiae]QBQ53282.1 LysM peptidoglycan-binding domain-containing protein [Nitrosococcus wardiae]